MYEDWELHHQAEVEFGEKSTAADQEREENRAGKSIILEITSPDVEESANWDFYAVTPLQVQIIYYALSIHVCMAMQSIY